MECIIFVLFFSINNTIFILFHENCDNFLKNWPFSPRFCPVIAKNSPTGRIHKPGDFWENQPLTGRSPGLPGEIAGLLLKYPQKTYFNPQKVCDLYQKKTP